jgi:hypothetical protein
MTDLTAGSIVVRVEFHDGATGNISEIARMHVAHIGFTVDGNYEATTLRNQNGEPFVRQQRRAIFRSDRLKPHVWYLIARALIAMGYPGKIERPRPASPTANQIKGAAALLSPPPAPTIPPCPVPLKSAL